MPNPTPATADRDPNGRLTYAALVETLRRGSTVVLDGRHVTRAQDLPSEADYVRGDAEAEAATLARLEAAQKAVEAQIAAIRPRAKAAK